MHLPFLQSSDFLPGPLTILLLLLVVGVGYWYFRKIVMDERQRKETIRDPRSHIVNDSNYNINRAGMDGHRTPNGSAAEAARIIEGLKEAEDIPSAKEFHTLRKGVNKPSSSAEADAQRPDSSAER